MIPRLATGAGSDGEALAAPSPEGARGVPEGASQNRSGLAGATAPLSLPARGRCSEPPRNLGPWEAGPCLSWMRRVVPDP